MKHFNNYISEALIKTHMSQWPNNYFIVWPSGVLYNNIDTEYVKFKLYVKDDRYSSEPWYMYVLSYNQILQTHKKYGITKSNVENIYSIPPKYKNIDDLLSDSTIDIDFLEEYVLSNNDTEKFLNTLKQ